MSNIRCCLMALAFLEICGFLRNLLASRDMHDKHGAQNKAKQNPIHTFTTAGKNDLLGQMVELTKIPGFCSGGRALSP